MRFCEGVIPREDFRGAVKTLAPALVGSYSLLDHGGLGATRTAAAQTVTVL